MKRHFHLWITLGRDMYIKRGNTTRMDTSSFWIIIYVVCNNDFNSARHNFISSTGRRRVSTENVSIVPVPVIGPRSLFSPEDC